MAIAFFPIDHLPVGPVTHGKEIVAGTNQGGGLRLTDYEVDMSSGHSPTELAMFEDVKYIRNGQPALPGYAPIYLKSQAVINEASVIYYGVRFVKRNSTPSYNNPDLMFIASGAVGNISGGNFIGTVFKTTDVDLTFGAESYLELEIKVGPEADGIAKRWVNGVRLTDVLILNPTIVAALRNRLFWIYVTGREDGFGLRDFYMASDALPNPVYKRLGPISEQRLTLETVNATDWTSNSGLSPDEFINNTVSNTSPFDQYIRTDNKAPLTYKVNNDSIPTDPIVGVMASSSTYRDTGLAIEQTVTMTNATVNHVSKRLLRTVPFTMDTTLQTDDAFIRPISKADLEDLTIEHTFTEINDD